jgi:hypothetical protein
MRTKQAARFLGVSPATLKRLLRQYHDHPAVQNIRRSSGGHRIFSTELLEALARTIDRAGQDIARRRTPQARRAWHRALSLRRARQALAGTPYAADSERLEAVAREAGQHIPFPGARRPGA